MTAKYFLAKDTFAKVLALAAFLAKEIGAMPTSLQVEAKLVECGVGDKTAHNYRYRAQAQLEAEGREVPWTSSSAKGKLRLPF
jgi:hypothetical protein